MAETHDRQLSTRIRTELIEANFEIAFNLIDLAEERLHEHDPANAFRALLDAQAVFEDIQQRLDRIGSEKHLPFDCLVVELRRAIALAKSHLD